MIKAKRARSIGPKARSIDHDKIASALGAERVALDMLTPRQRAMVIAARNFALLARAPNGAKDGDDKSIEIEAQEDEHPALNRKT